MNVSYEITYFLSWTQFFELFYGRSAAHARAMRLNAELVPPGIPDEAVLGVNASGAFEWQWVPDEEDNS